MTTMILIWSSPPTKAPRNFPTSPMASRKITASGSTTLSPPAARRDMTTRKWRSPRAAHGKRSNAISAKWARTSRKTGFHLHRRRRYVGRCVRQRHAAVVEHIRLLLGAFDHRHIFCDPRPPMPSKALPNVSACFALPRSSWADYDRKAISKGGGIFARSEKAIKISAPK